MRTSDWCLHIAVYHHFCVCLPQINLTLGSSDEFWWMLEGMADDSRSGPRARWVREPASLFPNDDIWFCLLLFLSVWQVQRRQSIALYCSHFLPFAPFFSPSLCMCLCLFFSISPAVLSSLLSFLWVLPSLSPTLPLSPSSLPSPRSVILDSQQHISVDN